MASEDSGRSRARTRERTRIVLVICCLLAVGLAGVLVPSLTGGVVDSPAESLVPGDAIQSGAAENFGELASSGLGDINASSLGEGAGGGGFGALNPGQSTDIGGSTGASAALGSQSTSSHFTVRSSSPAYWRTGAYDRYTGSGWEQTGETTSFDGTLSGDGIEGARVDYQVELNRSATALPTVWRPNSVDGVSNLRVTDQRALRAGDRLGSGTTYTGTSHRPPQDPQVLRTSGGNYPASIEERYTALPEDTPSRVGLFTDDITSNASTPYEKAVAIEEWLEANKEYSLDASATSDHMTDTFLFEMDTGYCEYFATSMTTMLRTQDIPARYVVGYSTGQQVGENTYEVRGMNAHAWVEVYFEDVGWVKFDPTPGSARLQQEQDSIQEQNPDADYSPTEQGSPGEEFSAEQNGSTRDGDGDGSGGDPVNQTTTGDTESGYQVTLNRTAVPGVPVAVTVVQDGQLQSGVTVLFNGDPIGQTDEDGTVVGTVPYTDELRVGVQNGSSARLSPPGDLPGDTGNRLYSVPTPAAGVGTPVTANLTVPVETNTTVAVTGETVPNANVTVTAAVGDVPLRNASVLVAGERVATTNRAGRATITLPDRGGNLTIAVERGSIRGTRNITLPTLSVEVRPTAPLALPYTDAVVTVTASGDPVSNAPVRIDGEQVATTDINGTATVTLPLAEAATISVTGAGVTEEATVAGLYTNLGLVALAVVLVVGGVFGLAYRRGYTPRDILGIVLNLPTLVVAYSQYLLVTVATRWDEALAILSRRIRTTLGYVRDTLRGTVTVSEVRAAFLAWLAETRARFGPDDDAPVADDGASKDLRTVRRAWRQFLGALSLRRPRTMTPGEIAQYAIDHDDLPAKPVEVLRDTFREVEYGARSAEDRLARVDEAVTAIEAEIREREAEEAEDGTDGQQVAADGGTT
jgi:transglutaminase-like putative cysteine protease